MPYDDGRNSARARSARIRASHEYEATHLEEMRRRATPIESRPDRASLLGRLRAVFARPHPNVDVAETDAIASAAHAE
jgi:hypothetical protein